MGSWSLVLTVANILLPHLIPFYEYGVREGDSGAEAD